MKPLAAILLAALHLALASLPCPPAAGDREAQRFYASGAIHATHSHGTGDAPRIDAKSHELRAPCPCGCRHASSEVPAARLGPALLRIAASVAAPSGAAPLAFAEPLLTDSAPGALDPVPRAA